MSERSTSTDDSETLQEVYPFNTNCTALALNEALDGKLFQAKAMAACFYSVDVGDTKPVDIQTYMVLLECLLNEAIELSEATWKKLSSELNQDKPQEETEPKLPLEMIDAIGIKTERICTLIKVVMQECQNDFGLPSILSILFEEAKAIDGIIYKKEMEKAL